MFSIMNDLRKRVRAAQNAWATPCDHEKNA